MESEQIESKRNIFQKTGDYGRNNPRKAGLWIAMFLLFIVGFFIPVESPHVAISGDPIFSNGPQWLTNSVIGTIVVDILLVLLALFTTKGMKVVPGGLQNLMEAVIEYMYNLSENVAGSNARKFFPWVMTIFLFVIVANWTGLIPGVGSIGMKQYPEEHPTEEHPVEEEGATEEEHSLNLGNQLAMAGGDLILLSADNRASEPLSVAPGVAASEEGEAHFVPFYRAPSADLNVTFALAIVTMVMVQVFGVSSLGGRYFGKFFTFKGEGGMRFINAFVGILELISEFSRVIAFGFRLFGNIFAGEVVLATMAFLITFLLPVPFYILELFVGFVQALVFMMLALVFFSMATISHDAEHH